MSRKSPFSLHLERKQLVFQANLAKNAATALGIEVIEATVSASNEIQQVVESVLDKADAIYISRR
jgi:putative ABC transport system substrate-binding protein